VDGGAAAAGGCGAVVCGGAGALTGAAVVLEGGSDGAAVEAGFDFVAHATVSTAAAIEAYTTALIIRTPFIGM